MAPAHIRIVLLASALFGTACTTPCEGASCGALYPRASLGLFRLDELALAEVDALSPAAEITTVDAEGYDWAVRGVTGGLVVGVPAAGEVRWYDAEAVAAGGGPTRSLTSEGVDDRFGAAVQAGEGPGAEPRLLVGAPDRTAGPARTGSGALSIYEGVNATLASATTPTLVLGTDAEAHLGEGVWACGDLDADGSPDWAATAPWSAAGPYELAGSVLLGLSSAIERPELHGGSSGARFGATVACATTFDADLQPDLVVAAPYADTIARDGAGTVSIWAGPLDPTAVADPDLTLAGTEPGAGFGTTLALGDLDGDGVPELVVGAPGVDGGAGADDATGAVYVYDGGALRDKLDNPLEVPTPDVEDGGGRTLRGEFVRGRFGSSVAIADLDGDGIGDLAVGAPGTNRTGEPSATRAGAATVWWGPHTAWPAVQFMSDAPVIVVADRQYLETGSVMTTTDLEGDGVAELVLLTRVASALE